MVFNAIQNIFFLFHLLNILSQETKGLPLIFPSLKYLCYTRN